MRISERIQRRSGLSTHVERALRTRHRNSHPPIRISKEIWAPLKRSSGPRNCTDFGIICSAVSENGNGSVYTAGIQNVVIVGSGPAGYTAAIYAARANLKPLVFEGVSAGGVRGGQLMTTNEVENFPGFPEGITGPDLMDRMRGQAQRWGAELVTEDVVRVDVTKRPFVVETDEISLRTNAIIMATGATARRLGLPSEAQFWSRGISACAICDGASPLFKGQQVAVVGGGDSATEEAHYVTKYARHVHLLVRGPSMCASKTMQNRVLQHSKITVHFNTEIQDAFGDDEGLKGLTLRHSLRRELTQETRDLHVRGLFYGIGHSPNSKLVAGQIDLDDAGYVMVQNGCETSVPGVFSAGDLHDIEWRQAVTAAGSGCMAAIATERYLTSQNMVIEFEMDAALGRSVDAADEAVEQEEKVQTVEAPFDPKVTRHKGQYALRKLYHESDRLLVVLYSSPSCGPCRSLKPMVNAVVDEFEGLIHYIDIDIADDPDIAEAAGVMGTPTVHCFKNKDRVENISGVKMKSEWRKMFSKYTEDSRSNVKEDAKEKVTV